MSATCASAGDWDSNSGSQYGTWSDSMGIGSVIANDQTTLQTQWSGMHGSVDTIGGDAAFQGAAAGNLVDIMTMNNTRVQNSQIVGVDAAIASDMNIGANNIWGSVGIQNNVLCNGASVSTDPVLTAVSSNQECHAKDPASSVTANVTNIAGTMAIQSMAMGNTFEADSNADNFPVMSRQFNNSISASTINANAYNIGGAMSLSSSAIGNRSQILHYSTH